MQATVLVVAQGCDSAWRCHGNVGSSPKGGMQQLPEASQHRQKTAEEIIPGSLKRSRSYAEELVTMTQETLAQLAQDRHSPLREKARAMLKLIKQTERLLEKTSRRGGSA